MSSKYLNVENIDKQTIFFKKKTSIFRNFLPCCVLDDKNHAKIHGLFSLKLSYLFAYLKPFYFFKEATAGARDAPIRY